MLTPYLFNNTGEHFGMDVQYGKSDRRDINGVGPGGSVLILSIRATGSVRCAPPWGAPWILDSLSADFSVGRGGGVA